MRLPRRQFLHLAAGATALPAVSRIARAQAQDFPARPVRIITHSAPGGSPDALLRIVADRLSQMWGRQVLALNHPGAGGAVAARTAAAAAPDDLVVERLRGAAEIRNHEQLDVCALVQRFASEVG